MHHSENAKQRRQMNQSAKAPLPHDTASLRGALVSARLLSDDEFADALSHASQADDPASQSSVAEVLCSRGVLTEFQVAKIKEGRWNELLVGDYILKRPLQKGGMGQLYEAWHPPLRRVVAIKSIAVAGFADDEDLRRRFDRELHVCGRLNHPNVVTIHDALILESGPWLVMEMLDGRDLHREVTSRGPLTVPRANEVTLQAARGLAHAHQAGVVHRDVKPANLFLDTAGVVHVLDFGLAALREPVPAVAGIEQLTRTGAVMGTAAFMAPEQASGEKDVDARADVYSLGCTIYFLLTGHTPFAGKSHVDQLLAHRVQEVPNLPESLDAPALNRVIRRMMEKAPSTRQQSMDEVIDDLKQLKSSDATSSTFSATDSTLKLPTFVAPAETVVHRRKPKWATRQVLGLAAALAAVAAVVAYLFWQPGVAPPRTWDELKAQLEAANPGLEIPLRRDEETLRYQNQDGVWSLDLSGLAALHKLVPLGEVPVDALYLNETRIDDLAPIADSNVTILEFGGTKVQDLTPIRGLALTHLALWRTDVTDLRPLQDMSLVYLDIHITQVEDLRPLDGMPLEELDVHLTKVQDVSVLAEMPLTFFDGSQTDIPSLKPLSGLPLLYLGFDKGRLADIDLLETWRNLQQVNDMPVREFLDNLNNGQPSD